MFMSELIKVATAGDVPENSAILVQVKGRPVALINKAGEYFAVDNACPHEGESLSQGDIEGDHVVCAYHGWKVNMKTGESSDIPGFFVGKFDVKVIENEIFIEV